MSYLKKVIGSILIIAGLALFLYPYVSEAYFYYQTVAYVEAFNEQYGVGGTESDESEMDGTELDDAGMAGTVADGKTCENSESSDDSASGENATSTEDEGTDSNNSFLLYQQCLTYNQKIYEEEQSGLVDAWSYEQAAIAVNADAFGYIEIPAMNLVMPLYLGASEENMAKGAVVLGQTSIPIGGENTNAVIAGHRGYRGSPYFREIEKLSIGDKVYITNQWETLTYTVTAIDIISPSDKDAIKIQEGKDMVTLITCHPYRSHGKQRYVVYCERSDGSEIAETEDETEDNSTGTFTASDGRMYELSGSDINREKTLRRFCGIILIGMLLINMVRAIYRKRKQKERLFREGSGANGC